MIYFLVAIAVWFSFPFSRAIWQDATFKIPHLPVRNSKFDILPFVLSFQISMAGSSTSRIAISEALKVIPDNQLVNTRRNLSADLEISSGLREDAKSYPELKLMVLALAISEFSGARMGDALDTLATEVLRARSENADIQAELAGTKATVAVLAGLPALGILMGNLLGANPFTWLLGNRYGLACLFSAIALEAVGLWWLRRLLKKAMQ